MQSSNGETAEQDDKIFEDVPLEEKLSEGFGAFYENLLKQREYTINAAAKLDEQGNRPPEIRVGNISSSGRVSLEFTNKMSFPPFDQFVSLGTLSESKVSNENRMMKAEDDDEVNLIEIVMFRGEEEELDQNLGSWEIVSVSDTLIEIDLHFEEPLQVSQGDQYEQLIV